MPNKKLIILDRDGVINHDSDDYIKSPEEWLPINGSLEAIAQLNRADYNVAIATNQSGIARGYYNLDTLEAMHNKMQKLLAKHGGHIDYIAFCPHGPDDNCTCRKPKPGMLLSIAEHFSVPSKEITFIGDTAGDRKAASAAKMKFALVKTGKGERTMAERQQEGNQEENYPVFNSLSDYISDLLG